MSLRARLTLFYTSVLAAVLVLFGLAVYGLISVVQLAQVDDTLDRTARDVIFVSRVDENATFLISQRVSLDSSVVTQVWDAAGRLVGISPAVEPDSIFRSPLDPENLFTDEEVFRTVPVGGTRYRILTVPLFANGAYIGVLQAGTSLAILDALRGDLLRYLILLSVIAILLTGVIGLIIGRRALAPLATVTDTALQITRADDLSRRIPGQPGPEDEVGRLILAFNDTMARLEKLFATQRRFVADIGHELRTPLTVIRGNLDLMRRVGVEDEQSLRSIELEVDRLARLVQDLLMLAQAESGKLPMDKRRVELDTVLLEVFNQSHVLAGDRVHMEIDKIDQVIVCGDRDRLKQVVLNLVANAIKYTGDSGTVTVSLSKHENRAKFTVKDTGAGIPAKDLPHVFERFYRGDKSRTRGKDGAGFGLGLSIAYWIVRNHGGDIEVKSKVNRGSTFTVWLPLATEDCPVATSDLREPERFAEPERVA
jgi:signal transduction histidine kinase